MDWCSTPMELGCSMLVLQDPKNEFKYNQLFKIFMNAIRTKARNPLI